MTAPMKTHTLLTTLLAALLLAAPAGAKDDKDRDARDARERLKDKTPPALAKPPLDAAASRIADTKAAATIDSHASVRYAPKNEPAPVEPVKTAIKSTATIETRRPVNYGSIKNAPATTVTVPGRLAATETQFGKGPRDLTPITPKNTKPVVVEPIRTEKPHVPPVIGRNDRVDHPVIDTGRRPTGADHTVIDSGRRLGTSEPLRRITAGERFSDRRPIDRLPAGFQSYSWKGHDYSHHDYKWYRPYWYNGYVTYWPVYPPAGYYYSTLPVGCSRLVIGRVVFYLCDGIYYSAAPGRPGYIVVDPPTESPTLYAPATPDPMAILQAMANYTTSRAQLCVNVSDLFDEVRDTGVKIQLADRYGFTIQQPGRFLAQYHSDTDDRVTLYDGRSVTLLDLRRNIFSQLPAAPTVASTVDLLARSYGLAFPLADLVTTDFATLAAPIISAQYVGLERVGAVACHHLAFAQENIAWEVWIDAGAAPIPRRYVITYTQLPQAPRYVSTVLAWDESPIPPTRFSLALPPGAPRVGIPPMGQ